MRVKLTTLTCALNNDQKPPPQTKTTHSVTVLEHFGNRFFRLLPFQTCSQWQMIIYSTA